MAFVDEVEVRAQAGKGGNGVIRWLRVKETAKGGPSGGDGGRGGDVVLLGVHDLAALANYRYEKKFDAQPGDGGDNFNRTGADGKDVVLKVPVGTVATLKNGVTFEITEEHQRVVV